MSSRTKQIKVGYRALTNDYVVISAKNSTAYNPGTRLCKAEVDDIVVHGNWDVVVVTYNPKEVADHG